MELLQGRMAGREARIQGSYEYPGSLPPPPPPPPQTHTGPQGLPPRYGVIGPYGISGESEIRVDSLHTVPVGKDHLTFHLLEVWKYTGGQWKEWVSAQWWRS